jgi:REP element-mobilizing transposase RayT
VKGRLNLISSKHKEELQKYITGIVQERKHKMLSINCMPDHTHVFIGMNPAQSISDIARDIKAVSSKFINDKKWIQGKFSWQEGFGAFSYSNSQVSNVVNYILNQEEHHKRTNFKEEYLKLLKDFKIDFSDKYLFEWIE